MQYFKPPFYIQKELYHISTCHCCRTTAPSTVDGHHRDSVDCVIGQSSECVLWRSSGWDGDQCVDTAIYTDIVAGSSGNRCQGHC